MALPVSCMSRLLHMPDMRNEKAFDVNILISYKFLML